MSAHPFPPRLSRLRHAMGASLLLLSILPAVRAAAENLVPVGYGTTIDLAAGTATFAMHFDRTPAFVNLADPTRPGDDFQFWTDTVSTNPVASTYAVRNGFSPLGTQMMVTTSFIRTRNQLNYVWPQGPDFEGPRDPGGWGSIEAFGDYTLSDDNTLSFDVPLSLLHAADGHFYYIFRTYQAGAGDLNNYFGVSGMQYPSSVPEPAAVPMLAAGLALVAAACR